MKKSFNLLVSMLITFTVFSQNKKQQDIASIKKMCGCFEVKFNFVETFSYSKDSLYKPSKKKETDIVLEYAQLVEEGKDKISIQHLLQMGEADKTHVIKHWRQDWLYENTSFYTYNGDNEWLYESKNKDQVKGQWTQKVFQVDDSPRYENSSSWVHIDGKSYWENTTTAPLPRREYTQRNDYNVTLRGNRHEITASGWIHDQDNQKLIREKGKQDIVLAKEKGFNTYTRVPESRCAGAKKWWSNNKNKWVLVRNKWGKVFNKKETLVLKTKVDNKPLYKHLFDENCTKETDIESTIQAFVVN